MTRILEYVEIDVDFCSLTYGTSPCTASLGVTGTKKCFNSLNTCQDRLNFNNVPVTLRFATDTGYNPDDIEAIPSITNISISPSEISLGEDLGIRSSVTITFKDHRHSDTGPGFDKYIADRFYDPYTQGTFWGKFRARQPFLRGRALRLIRGELGQAIGAMQTRHYVIDSFTGPSSNGTFKIVAKDFLKLADNDRAVAPAPSGGALNAAITDSDTSATLSPSGIGDAEYPTIGIVAIGGKEICNFTRVGDVLTLTRAQQNTEAQAHTASSRVQIVLEYSGISPDVIIRDLLVTYAGVPSSYISVATWDAEVDAFLQRVYTGRIVEPTGVNKLVSELIEQAALALWWDDLSQTIKLQVLRDVTKDAQIYDDENIVQGSMQISDQQNRRVSQVWVYFAQRNPLRPLSDLDNYKSIFVDVNAQNETDFGSASIKVVTSRWIPEFGSSIANRLTDLILARFSNAPRKIEFDVFNTAQASPQLGGGYNVGSFALQDDQGATESVPVQVRSVTPGKTAVRISAEELRFDGVVLDDPNNRVVTIDNDTLDFNLETVHDTLFPPIVDATGLTLTVNVNAGVIVGSTSNTTAAFTVGAWAGITTGTLDITVVVNGRIQGAGGDGGHADTASAGEPGGTALLSTYAFTLENNGEIYGGGGGGGYGRTGQPAANGPGGGGSGSNPGKGGRFPNGSASPAILDGTTEAGGIGFPAAGASPAPGAGGGVGAAGVTGSAAGGAAGNAIDGVSNATITAAGTRAGPEIN